MVKGRGNRSANHGLTRTLALWCYQRDTDRWAMAQVGSDTDWRHVASQNDAYTPEPTICAIKQDDSLWCWGRNEQGQVGDATDVSRATPVRIGGAAEWLDVAVGGLHSCAIKRDGTLWCWGSNQGGGLGDGTGQDRRSPGRIGEESDWARVFYAGPTCAARRDGALWCWGAPRGEVPAPEPGGDHVKSLTHAAVLMCGVKSDSTLWCTRLSRSVLF